MEWQDYNHDLKDYVLNSINHIEMLAFTSGENCNGALTNFKIIMGKDFAKIKNKCVSDLPSPSGGSNMSNFSKDDGTLGLKSDFYRFVVEQHAEYIEYITQQWQKRKIVPG